MTPSLPRALSPRDRRALVWGGAIGAAALVFVLGVKPYFRALRETKEELTMQRDLLARERGVLSASSLFPAALEKSRTTLAQASTPLFDALDELSATSDLSDHISKAALMNRVQLQQLETRRAVELDQGIAALAVDFRAEGDFEGLLRFLNALDRGDKLVNVSALTVQRQDRPVAAGVPDTEVLSIAGTVTGYGSFPESIGRADTASPAKGRPMAPDTL